MGSGEGNCGEGGKRGEGADREGRGTGWSAPCVGGVGQEEVGGEEEGQQGRGGGSVVAPEERVRERVLRGEV